MAVQRRYLELFLEEGAEILASLGQAVLRLEEGPGDAASLRAALRLTHTLKGGAKMVGLEQVSHAAHDMETRLQAAERGKAPLGTEDRRQLLGVLDRIRDVLSLLSRGKEAEALACDPGAVPASTAEPSVPEHESPHTGEVAGTRGGSLAADRMRVSVDRLDDLQNLVDDLALQRSRLLARGKQLKKALRALETVSERAWETARPEDLASLRHVARLLTDRDSFDFVEDLYRLDQLGAEIQDRLIDLRMVPAIEAFDGFQRVVRDLGQELGKDTVLRVEGEFTEIDKRLLDAVHAPLLHLIRNAVDHGVELPAEREQLGKPARAEVWIRAYHKGSAVVIEVEDDGRGLSAEEIKRAAVERGLLDEDRSRALGDAEALYLVCEPGFTTRATPTEVSGRGVGLDVVKAQVEQLKGSLVVQGEKGRFARFRLYLPLSISSLSVLAVRVGTERYAIPSQFVDRCVAVSREELAAGDAAWSHAGRVWPVVSLARVVGAESDDAAAGGGLVILKFRGVRMILHVDELQDERVVILKALGKHLTDVPYVLGVSLPVDGPPVPVLNVLDVHAHWSMLEATCRFQLGTTRKPAVVLVVDDSMTTRHLEQNLLENMGFRVLLAADGVDAWRTLDRHGVDAVLTDLDMPNMDGLELTRRIRGRPEWERLPVVAVTNRTAERDMEAGFAAGVDAYLRKDRFNQRELARTLDQLLSRPEVDPDRETGR